MFLQGQTYRCREQKDHIRSVSLNERFSGAQSGLIVRETGRTAEPILGKSTLYHLISRCLLSRFLNDLKGGRASFLLSTDCIYQVSSPISAVRVGA